MKIRSATELQDLLDNSLARRKRELTTLRFQIINCRRNHEQDVLLRTALPMLYAHWEGFIKYTATAYLQYVSRQRIPLRNLRRNFIALACRNEIFTSSQAKKVSLHQQMLEHIFNNLDNALPLYFPESIDTDSNLTSSVLKEIFCTIGIDFDHSWETKIPLIDHQLLKNRNEIAHGELTPVDIETYEQLHSFVILSLIEFKKAIENAVALKIYISN